MISVVIPAYNEEAHIQETIQKLWQYDREDLIKEIIIVDGGSTDNTGTLASSAGATVVTSRVKARSVQMNLGATVAKEKVLYFLHADSTPPQNFTADISKAVEQGYGIGCYRLAFDYKHWLLKANCWFTRFDVNAFRFGDQSLFVTKEIFDKSGRFREDLLLMEDQEIIGRLRKNGKFVVMKKAVTTSARKYVENGVYKMHGIYVCIWLLYYLGCSQEYLLKLHRKFIKRSKL